MSEYKKEKTQFGEKTQHPSYGTLKFSRVSSSRGKPLFGSSIQHKDTIVMTLYHAELTRGLNNDRIYGHNAIARAEMSYSQFAESITSMNMGSGVPVTIRWTEKDGEIPPCDFVNKKEQFQDELKERLDNATKISRDLINEVQKMFAEKKNFNKTDKEDIIRKLNEVSAEINSNVNFTYKMFNEQMDKTIMEAKGEIESFCQNKINSIAQAALMEHQEDFQKLSSPIDIDL